MNNGPVPEDFRGITIKQITGTQKKGESIIIIQRREVKG